MGCKCKCCRWLKKPPVENLYGKHLMCRSCVVDCSVMVTNEKETDERKKIAQDFLDNHRAQRDKLNKRKAGYRSRSPERHKEICRKSEAKREKKRKALADEYEVVKESQDVTLLAEFAERAPPAKRYKEHEAARVAHGCSGPDVLNLLANSFVKLLACMFTDASMDYKTGIMFLGMKGTSAYVCREGIRDAYKLNAILMEGSTVDGVRNKETPKFAWILSFKFNNKKKNKQLLSSIRDDDDDKFNRIKTTSSGIDKLRKAFQGIRKTSTTPITISTSVAVKLIDEHIDDDEVNDFFKSIVNGDEGTPDHLRNSILMSCTFFSEVRSSLSVCYQSTIAKLGIGSSKTPMKFNQLAWNELVSRAIHTDKFYAELGLGIACFDGSIFSSRFELITPMDKRERPTVTKMIISHFFTNLFDVKPNIRDKESKKENGKSICYLTVNKKAERKVIANVLRDHVDVYVSYDRLENLEQY